MPFKDKLDRDRFNEAYYISRNEEIHQIIGTQCVCCGENGTNRIVESDHIVPRKQAVRRNLSQFSNEPLTNFQALCEPCNASKGEDDSICRIHRKYLGVWNVLPSLYDMESI